MKWLVVNLACKIEEVLIIIYAHICMHEVVPGVSLPYRHLYRHKLAWQKGHQLSPRCRCPACSHMELNNDGAKSIV